MDDTSASSRSRELTKILADLDLLFELVKDEDGRHVWALRFDQGSTTVHLYIGGALFFAVHMSKINRALTKEEFQSLLELNTRVAGAKIAVFDDPEHGSILWVGIQLPSSALRAEIVKFALGSVTTAVREARKIIEPAA